MIHKRKCHDCGNVAEHTDNVTPEVCCKKCGSQDTRLVREKVVPRPADEDPHGECRDEIRRLQGELSSVRQSLNIELSKSHQETWLWQGDGYDFPESLTCPVIMHAETLRDLLGKLHECNLTMCAACGARVENSTELRKHFRECEFVRHLASAATNQTQGE